MLQLIRHILQISASRDRTAVSAAMIEALKDLFHPLRITIFRCHIRTQRPMVHACAHYGPEGTQVRNAYLPEKRHCHPLAQDPLLHRCRKEKSAALDFMSDGSHRVVFPVMAGDEPAYMIDLQLTDNISADQRAALLGLLEYFGNHIALLDYGETDTLTGLYSRKTFDKHLFELLGHSHADRASERNHPRRRHGANDSPHWLAVCDIDFFKHVNDTHGHLVGDEALVMLAQVMRHAFRFDDHLFRFGGEEFIALLQPADEANAHATLERFRKRVESYPFGDIGHITVSIGFSALRPDDTPANVIDRADAALYYAKHHGRNRVECYEYLVRTDALPANATSAPAAPPQAT